MKTETNNERIVNGKRLIRNTVRMSSTAKGFGFSAMRRTQYTSTTWMVLDGETLIAKGLTLTEAKAVASK